CPDAPRPDEPQKLRGVPGEQMPRSVRVDQGQLFPNLRQGVALAKTLQTGSVAKSDRDTKKASEGKQLIEQLALKGCNEQNRETNDQSYAANQEENRPTQSLMPHVLSEQSHELLSQLVLGVFRIDRDILISQTCEDFLRHGLQGVFWL